MLTADLTLCAGTRKYDRRRSDLRLLPQAIRGPWP